MNKLKFANKSEENSLSDINSKKWKILIADDEPEVHTITKTVLSSFEFENKRLEFLSSYSGEETIKILQENDDIAIILLDVVMETDDAGLIVAQRIREELKNHLIRIILRTGQPGSAPEKDVIRKYEINDYKEKTELTTSKLYTTIMSSLRSYRDLLTIEQNRNGLSKIIESTRTLFKEQSLELFAEGVLIQLESILKLNHESIIINNIDGFTVEENRNNFEIIAATGKFKNKNKEDIFDEEIKNLINKAIENKSSYFKNGYYIAYFGSDNNISNIIFMTGCKDINALDEHLITIFASNVSVAFNNLYLTKEIMETQEEIINTLGEVIEKRSKESIEHVKRVSKLSYILAKEYGLSEEQCLEIKTASPMHDIGKIGIPDSILLKSSKLNEEEFEVMKSHSEIGHNILSKSKREILKISSIVAYEHHEKWDGSGYPRGLKGDEIHIYGRITAIADVFDALLHKRCYKEAWPLENVLELLKEQKEKHFDPKLVDIILDNIDKIKEELKL